MSYSIKIVVQNEQTGVRKGAHLVFLERDKVMRGLIEATAALEQSLIDEEW